MKVWKVFAAAGAAAALAAAGLWLAREVNLRRAAAGFTQTMGRFPCGAEGPDEQLAAEEAARRYGDAAAPRRRVFYDQDADRMFPDPPGADEPAAPEAPPAAEEAPAAEKAPAAPDDAPARPEQGPGRNPVEAPPAQPPRTPSGRLDATRIACAEDFQDWDDLGCRG